MISQAAHALRQLAADERRRCFRKFLDKCLVPANKSLHAVLVRYQRWTSPLDLAVARRVREDEIPYPVFKDEGPGNDVIDARVLRTGTEVDKIRSWCRSKERCALALVSAESVRGCGRSLYIGRNRYPRVPTKPRPPSRFASSRSRRYVRAVGGTKCGLKGPTPFRRAGLTLGISFVRRYLVRGSGR